MYLIKANWCGLSPFQPYPGYVTDFSIPNACRLRALLGQEHVIRSDYMGVMHSCMIAPDKRARVYLVTDIQFYRVSARW